MKKLLQLLAIVSLTSSAVTGIVSYQSLKHLNKVSIESEIKKNDIQSKLNASVQNKQMTDEEAIAALNSALNDVEGISSVQVDKQNTFGFENKTYVVKVVLKSDYKWDVDNFDGQFKVTAKVGNYDQVIKEDIQSKLNASVQNKQMTDEEAVAALNSALNDVEGISSVEVDRPSTFAFEDKTYNVKVVLKSDYKWDVDNFDGQFEVSASIDDTSKIVNHLNSVKQKTITWFAEQHFDARKWVGTYPGNQSLSKSIYTQELYEYLGIENDIYIKDIEHFTSPIEQVKNSNQSDEISTYKIVIIPENTVDQSNNNFDDVLKPFAINFNKQTIEEALNDKTIEVDTFIGKNEQQLTAEIETILKENNENIKWDVVSFYLDINKPSFIYLMPAEEGTFFYTKSEIELKITYLEIPAITNNLELIESKNRKVENKEELLIEIKQTLIRIDERLNDNNIEIILIRGSENIESVQTDVFTKFEVVALQNSKLRASKTFEIIPERKSVDVVLSNLVKIEVDSVSVGSTNDAIEKARSEILKIDSDLTDDEVVLGVMQGTVPSGEGLNIILTGVTVDAKPNSRKYKSKHLIKLVLTNNQI
ncbi:hypothetical protein [Mesoplasma coleopterae]|uniref:Uncharacterized protein n=1 Tax=Mesoplasma coleopterae TaxID=324078 RepID=A0A2K8P2K6_9MOLU|nr:hypothetical protein [Mesoplasma coleopterae]ATZ20959.1 hypothetical protein MCOLE_v1c04470 [Mesoplasma coleopterae]